MNSRWMNSDQAALKQLQRQLERFHDMSYFNVSQTSKIPKLENFSKL